MSVPEKLDRAIPSSEWVWCGYAGHFVAAASCRFHLSTRVGDYRISTVGDYYPRGVREPVGLDRYYETMVFKVAGDGEGEVSDWSEVAVAGYQEAEEAEVGHLAMCHRYALFWEPT